MYYVLRLYKYNATSSQVVKLNCFVSKCFLLFPFVSYRSMGTAHVSYMYHRYISYHETTGEEKSVTQHCTGPKTHNITMLLATSG